MSAVFSAYQPPAPVRRSDAMTFARLIFNRRRDLLTLMPDSAYELLMSRVPISKHPIWIVNHPDTVHEVLVVREADFAKGDLMVETLKPLTGTGLLVADGAGWQRQHGLVAAAFGQDRLPATTSRMATAIAEIVQDLGKLKSGTELDIGGLAGQISTGALYRALFSGRAAAPGGQALVEALTTFEACLASLDPSQLFTRSGPVVAEPDAATRDAAARLRSVIGQHVTRRMAPDAAAQDDILGALIAARDPATGTGFGPEEIIDQIATFLIAGHETVASMLTWCLFILSQQPDVADRIGEEARALAGDGPIGPGAVKGLHYTRQILKEVLRLYPPLAFILRTALKPMRIRKFDVEPGDLVVISPWLIHRHEHFWSDPVDFKPGRFAPGASGEQLIGSYLPFGTGARACVGAAVAEVEGMLALAALCRSFRFDVLKPEAVMPVCRMTISPEKPIRARLRPV